MMIMGPKQALSVILVSVQLHENGLLFDGPPPTSHLTLLILLPCNILLFIFVSLVHVSLFDASPSCTCLHGLPRSSIIYPSNNHLANNLLLRQYCLILPSS